MALKKAAAFTPATCGSEGREPVLPATGDGSKAITLAGYQINRRECWRSELLQRCGRNVVRIGRWRADQSGALHPAGVGIECSANHFDGFAAMLTAARHHLAKGGHET